MKEMLGFAASVIAPPLDTAGPCSSACRTTHAPLNRVFAPEHCNSNEFVALADLE